MAHHPARGQKAKSAKSARNEISAIRTEVRRDGARKPFGAHQPRNIALAVAEGHLLTRRVENLLDDAIRFVAARRIKVDQTAPEAHVLLVTDHAAHAPEHRLRSGNLGLPAHSLRAPGHNPQSRRP